MPKELKVKTAQKGKKVAIRDVLEECWAYGNSLLEATVYAYKEGSLKIGLWIGRLVDTKSLNWLRIQPELDNCMGIEL